MNAMLPSSAATHIIRCGGRSDRQLSVYTVKETSRERERARDRWICRNEALKGSMASGDEAGQGRMSPGRQGLGFSGCDGSTLKNTGVLFPPACVLVSLSHSISPFSIFYLLHLVSLFLIFCLSTLVKSVVLILSSLLCPKVDML